MLLKVWLLSSCSHNTKVQTISWLHSDPAIASESGFRAFKYLTSLKLRKSQSCCQPFAAALRDAPRHGFAICSVMFLWYAVQYSKSTNLENIGQKRLQPTTPSSYNTCALLLHQ
eukprot:SAG11_NODE_100_length_16863_cov_12.374911_12_plen_114_part_00